MCTGHVFIAMSLDGFIAREDHSLDWLPQESSNGEDFGYDSFINGMDGLVMGSTTFKKVLSFDPWPYTKPVVVLSHTLTDTDIPNPLHGKVRITAQSPKEIMTSLNAEGWQHAYIDGGRLIQSFLREGLIQDLIVTTIPILIGSGQRLFGSLEKDIPLRYVQSCTFSSGITQTRYRVASE